MQRIENEKERERLQVLLTKFERHVSEKENDIEQVLMILPSTLASHDDSAIFFVRSVGNCSKI